MTEIKVPSLGESVSEATVAQWLKKEGESVKADEPIVELETDKVTLEVNAPEDGVITKITIGEGEDVEVGAILGEIEAGEAANDSQDKDKDKKDDKKPAESKKEEKDEESSKDASDSLSPAVRKLINDNDLDASDIKGTGKEGRIVKGDVLDHLENRKASKSAPEPKKEEKPHENRDLKEREERVKMTRLRQKIAEKLKEAQNTAAMLTTFNEVDMTAVMEARKQYQDSFIKKHDVKLGFMSFFTKACVNALKEYPAVNAEIDGTDIIYKNYYDISMAVSTPQGLVVPVIKECDSKSMAQIEKDIIDVGTRARDGKLSIDELSGGSFTITNGGIFGSLNSTPIINSPQSAILGMHKIQQRPIVMADGSIAARPMMYLALSYDHRIVDGKEAVSFLVRVKDALEDPKRLLMEV